MRASSPPPPEGTEPGAFVDRLYALKTRLRLRERLGAVLPAIDAATVVPTAIGALHFYALKRIGLPRLKLNRRALDLVGIYPVRDHYYEPYFSSRHMRRPLEAPRDLPGLEIDLDRATALLERLGQHGAEPVEGPVEGTSDLHYRQANGTYQLPDAAVLYAMLRTLRPQRVIEVGGGNSTLVTLRALAKNREQGAPCDHLCIEPFEMPWLERTGTRVLRRKVEDVSPLMFAELSAGDVVFIDNSHMIRPQGDVLYVVQELLPRLAPGVVVHIHDLFTPYDYPASWLLDKMLLWNEQYLVEAFLTCNERFEILVPSFAMYTDRRAAFGKLRPELGSGDWGVPTSLWLRRKPEPFAIDPLRD